MKLLHLDSSILGENSASRAISAAVVERLEAIHPDLEITHRDLVADPIAHLDLNAFTQLDKGAEVQEFLDADIVVIGAGFYNFSIPSQLKAWIDRICVRGRTFTYSEAGPVGLAGGKRVVIVLARGGVYQSAPRIGFEHAETLLRSIFTIIGIEPEFIIAEGLSMGDEARRAAVEGAIGQAGRLAAIGETKATVAA